jgi:ADP-ribose pyrophosphatase YjhB (NUDIX family)
VCPRCGTDLERAPDHLSCPGCGSRFYANAEPTACAVVVDGDGRVLLGRRAHPPYRGRWDLPGGFLDEAEHPLDALRRELREETGLEVEPDRFLGAWLDRYADGPEDTAPWTLNLYWTARALSGDEQAADDVSELRWFAADDLPPDEDLAFTNVVQVLRAWRQQQA